MTDRKVRSSVKVNVSPAGVWGTLRDFCSPWHPWVESMRAERSPHGALIRAFTVQGESTLYREQLTFFSDSDKTYCYTHLEGIEGVDTYQARLSVTATGKDNLDTAEVTLQASISAHEPRAEEIATGTHAVFDHGTRALAELAGNQGFNSPESDHRPPSVSARQPGTLTSLRVTGHPALAVTTNTCFNLSTTQAALAQPEGDRGPLCLMLHGIGGNRSNWAQQLEVLSTDYSVAAMDLRGYGDSRKSATDIETGHTKTSQRKTGHTKTGHTVIDDYCNDILRVREALGHRRLVLCGLSYGSWIATSFAMRYPELLDGLVLSGGCTGMSEAKAAEREAFLASRQVPLDAGQTPADFASAVVAVLAGPNASDAVRQQLSESMAAISCETYRDALLCFTHPQEQFDFSKLSMPVLLMTGEHDRLAPPAEIKEVAIRIAGASPMADVRYETLADAGHVCNLENPDEFNRVLLEFLGRIVR